MRLAFAGGAVVDVTSDDDAVLGWLHELFAPSLGDDPGTAPAWKIDLRASASAVMDVIDRRPPDARVLPAFALDSQLVELPGWRSDGAVVLDDHERHAVIVLEGHSITVMGDPVPKRWRFTVALVVYELVAVELRREWVELHAGAVVHGGGAHLIVGPKGAGKTTLSIALARAGAGLLANDRSFARPGEAVGLPTPVKLLPPTLELLPELVVSRPPRPYLWRLSELPDAAPVERSEEVWVQLAPADVVGCLGSPAAAGAHPLASILVPAVAADCTAIERSTLPPDDAERALAENLYRGATGERVTTVFEQAGGGRPPVRRDLLAELARRHPVHRVRLGSAAVRDPETLLSILDGAA